jgi:hypothetical protein
MAWARIVRKFTGLLDIVAAALIAGNDGKSMALTWNNTAQTLTATPNPNFDSLTVNDTTVSTNTTTGALNVAGGVGVQGNINGLIFKASGGSGQIIGDSNTAPIATGNNWVAQGASAGRSNIDGYAWLAQGANAGRNNTTGFQWISQGASSGFNNINGSQWLAQGVNAGRNNIGSSWIAQGFEAGFTETRSNTWHVGVSRNKSLVVGLFDADCLYIGNTTINPTPTAAAHLAASTASRASLRIDSGVAPTSPNVGDVWKTSAGIIFEDNLSLNSGFVYKIAETQVVGPRETGWTAGTGTADKGAFDTTTATLADCAERILALEQALRTHGLIN